MEALMGRTCTKHPDEHVNPWCAECEHEAALGLGEAIRFVLTDPSCLPFARDEYDDTEALKKIEMTLRDALLKAGQETPESWRSRTMVEPRSESEKQATDCIQVLLHPALVDAFKAWLGQRGCHLFRIPTSLECPECGDEDLPTFGVGVGAHP